MHPAVTFADIAVGEKFKVLVGLDRQPLLAGKETYTTLEAQWVAILATDTPDNRRAEYQRTDDVRVLDQPDDLPSLNAIDEVFVPLFVPDGTAVVKLPS